METIQKLLHYQHHEKDRWINPFGALVTLTLVQATPIEKWAKIPWN
jgi:hypothetical protein